MSKKLCKDCEYARRLECDGQFMECHHPKNHVTIDLTTGKETRDMAYCSTHRGTDWLCATFFGFCGKSGRWFKQKTL